MNALQPQTPAAPNIPAAPYTPATANPTTRRGAIGKALLVWLFSGSLGIAVVAFIIFYMMGC